MNKYNVYMEYVSPDLKGLGLLIVDEYNNIETYKKGIEITVCAYDENNAKEIAIKMGNNIKWNNNYSIYDIQISKEDEIDVEVCSLYEQIKKAQNDNKNILGYETELNKLGFSYNPFSKYLFLN